MPSPTPTHLTPHANTPRSPPPHTHTAPPAQHPWDGPRRTFGMALCCGRRLTDASRRIDTLGGLSRGTGPTDGEIGGGAVGVHVRGDSGAAIPVADDSAGGRYLFVEERENPAGGTTARRHARSRLPQHASAPQHTRLPRCPNKLVRMPVARSAHVGEVCVPQHKSACSPHAHDPCIFLTSSPPPLSSPTTP